MAGLKGNVAWVTAQKQTVKGTAATLAALSAYKMPLSGGNIGPVRENDNLSETDSSRDRGVSYTTSSGVEGTPEFYVRDAPAGFWLGAALGGWTAPSGTMPNFTHTITPGNTLPYITVFKMIGDTLYERYTDCKVGSLSISAEAGQPLTMAAGIQGIKYLRQTTDPTVTPAIVMQSGPVYNFNKASVTLAGGATALVRSFELNIENNLTRQQTDDIEPYDVVEGLREISLSFDLIFEDLTEYNKFHTGSASGTTISPDIYTTSAVFTFDGISANNQIAFNLPVIAYDEFPVEPDAGGDPIVASISASLQRNTPIMTATVKNQVASY